MDEVKKQAIAASMWDSMIKLRQEEEELVHRGTQITLALCSMAEVWDRLELGPYPDPGISELLNIKDPPVEVEEDAGMTERILAILKAGNNFEMTPTQVRDRLVETGFKLQGRSNPMAEIHTVLKRLAQKRKRIGVTERDGVIYYFYDNGVPLKKGA
jgi:hypothetical protein